MSYMKKTGPLPYIINSISELHLLFSLPAPAHPLISVIDLREINSLLSEISNSIVFNFYSVWLEKGVEGRIRYGQNYFDFDKGSMIFISPGQVVSTGSHHRPSSGWGLIIHPDFLKKFSLAKIIKGYKYFSYSVNEALFLSEKEEAIVTSILMNILDEYSSVSDNFSHDVIISQIDLLLNYCDRFYNRQSADQKNAEHDFLTSFESLLSNYIDGGMIKELGLPTVLFLAKQLNVSPGYLSDLLRALTGQNAQQHIHMKLIEKAKVLISTTSLSVSEIAFRLGFEHPQSFSKLFKNKTGLSPLQYKKSFNFL
jgi:AraC family transcriptional activator of pobA